MKSTDNPLQLPLQGKIVEEAMRKAGRAAKLFHKRMGYPIVVWKDGKVVEIPPEDIVIEDEEGESSIPLDAHLVRQQARQVTTRRSEMPSTVSEHATGTDVKKLERLLQKSVRAAKLLHKQTGHPIVVWKDGKVVEIPPEEIVIDDEE